MSSQEAAESTAPGTRSKYHPAVMARRLYHWVVHWADTPHAPWALFLIAFAESSFFPIAPDVLLIAMGVGAPRRALWFAAVCLLGSVLGGIAGYYIGWGLWQVVGEWFFAYVPGFTHELFDTVVRTYHDNAFFTVFTAGFTPIPYKVITITAGVAQISFATFIVASVIGRGARFFLVGGMLRIFGPSVQKFIDRYFELLAIAFTLLLIGGFVVLKYAL